MNRLSLLLISLVLIPSLGNAQNSVADWKKKCDTPEYRASVDKDYPFIDSIIKFKSNADRRKATDWPFKTSELVKANEQGLHPSPNFLQITSYECLRCRKIINISTFRPSSEKELQLPGESPDDSLYYSKYERCPNFKIGGAKNVETDLRTEDEKYVDQMVKEKKDEEQKALQDFPAERFLNSSCYSLIGFSPDRDRAKLDKQYCECENMMLWKKLRMAGIILVLVGIVFSFIWLARRKSA